MSEVLAPRRPEPAPDAPRSTGWLRDLNLAIVVLVAIALYDGLYVQGAVGTQVLADHVMTLRYFLVASVVGNAVAALASPADLTRLRANGAKVNRAVDDSPEPWRTWCVCVAAHILFPPCISGLAGRWSPRRARQDPDRLEHAVQREMQALGVA